MLVPLCNCNRHFSFFPSEAFLKPSCSIPSCHYPKFPIKSSRRRFCISAAAVEADSRTLPQSAIQRIAEKLRSLGYVEEESSSSTRDEPSISGPNSPGEIFIPLPNRLPKFRLGHTLDPSWSSPDNPVPEPGSGNSIQRFHELRRGVLEEKERFRKLNEGNKQNAPSLAELTLPEEELRRLRSIGIALKKKLKVGRCGITEGIVNGIHERWRRTELVKIACEDLCRLNMKRTHEILERKTGGLVIWRSGSNIILYRGSDYKYPYFLVDKLPNDSSSEESPDIEKDQRILNPRNIQFPVTNETSVSDSNKQISHPPVILGVGLPNRVRFQLSGEAELAEEANTLLEGLGPRFNDWWGYDPLPVDADLLPAVVPGYKRPFRLLPYGIKPKLTNDEMTTLKRLGRPLPCHFVLGRNRKLQGLASAIAKLWEKCEIAKIAIKRGSQNTNSELMAEEIKWLTGGTLLSRDKEFIVFYRGKDFLPSAVSSAIEERRKYGLDVTEKRMDDISVVKDNEHYCGTEENATEVENDTEHTQNLQILSEMRRAMYSEAAVKITNNKLSMALEKKARAEKLLAELEKNQIPQQPAADREGITEEERYMLRKVGLRMKAFLLLGRRGVFDGTVENMHLHWKYRELVKVCVGRRKIEEVHGIARTLEAESGGILVAVEPVSKGYAIIVYRGKNYTRPASLRPRTLLSKREAMKRSLEAQRRESLKLHVLKLSKHVDSLKLKMANDEDENDMQLTRDLEPGSVDPENNDSLYIDDKISDTDHEYNCQSYFRDSASEARESNQGTDATLKDTEVANHTIRNSVDFTRQNMPRNILFHKTEAEVQPKSLPRRSRHVGRLEGHTHSSTTNITLSSSANMDSVAGGHQNAEFKTSVPKASNERPPVMPSKVVHLSNKERLLLRKQALKLKKPPVLSVGKSNMIVGVAREIKNHFKKHPLAIVHIKGRAKGTSAREVIYNLEQATGGVLVSQEPSKVILYRGWGSGIEADEASTTGELKSVSLELISAIKLECGLKSIDEEHIPSEDGSAYLNPTHF